MYSTQPTYKIPKTSVSKNLLTKLHDICSANIEDFAAIQGLDTIANPDGALYYGNKNASILGVAHLDHVLFSKPKIKKSKKGNWTCRCPQLDDRLGAWVLLYVLPQMGITTDILLTDEEESGNSTAKWFEPPKEKEYNWIFEFDRRGTDVVLYQYETQYSKSLMSDNGFSAGWGTFSDIASLEHLNVLGFNFGTGYYGEHTQGCYANLSHTLYMCRKFVKFFNKWSHEKLKFDAKDSINPWGNMWGYQFGQSYEYYDGHCYGHKRNRSGRNFQNTTQSTEPIGKDFSSLELAKRAKKEENQIRDWHDEQVDKQKRRQTGTRGTPSSPIDIHPSQFADSKDIDNDSWVWDEEVQLWRASYEYGDNIEDNCQYKCEICGEYYSMDELTTLDDTVLCVYCQNSFEVHSLQNNETIDPRSF